MSPGRIKQKKKGQILKQESWCLTETALGWELSGLVNPELADIRSRNPNAMCCLDNEIKTFAKFWEIKDVAAHSLLCSLPNNRRVLITMRQQQHIAKVHSLTFGYQLQNAIFDPGRRE